MGAREDAENNGILLDPAGKWDEEFDLGYPLLCHMLDVAAVALQLWDRFLTPCQRGIVADGMGVTQRQARSLVALFAALHDLGKASWWQQTLETAWARLPQALREDTDGWDEVGHARATALVLIDVLGEWGYAVDSSQSPGVRIAQALSAHHGWFLPLDLDGAASPARVREALGGPAWQDLRRRYACVVRFLLRADTVPRRMSVPAAVLLAGMGVVADHLASQRHEWLPHAKTLSFGAADHFGRVRPVARRILKASGLERVYLPRAGFARAHGLAEPTPLQASLMERMPGLVAEYGTGIVVVSDSPGGGKTVACLELQRIFTEQAGTQGALHLLPTTATADQTWEGYERYVRAHRPKRAPVALVHHRNRFNPTYTATPVDPETSAPRATALEGWLRGWDRALLAQWCVAAIDQALMAVLPVKFNMVRLLALSGKTVIIDEVDAFTAFTTAHLERLLEWLGALGSPVVLVSATLPAGLCDRLVRAYLRGTGRTPCDPPALEAFRPPCPGWLFVPAGGGHIFASDPETTRAQAARQRRTVKIHHHPVYHRPTAATPRRSCGPAGLGPRTREDAIRRLVGPVVRRGGVAAVVCATVALAQSTWEQLRAAFPDAAEDIVLLHANLPEGQRQRATEHLFTVLGPVGRRPRRLVVVVTSLLDIGVDVDADVMATDLTALPRLIQRLGRVWRFEHRWASEGLARRPAWLRRLGPRLHVLEPVGSDGSTRLPDGWPLLEDPYRLHATAAWLRAASTVTLPDHLPELADHLHQPPREPELATRFAGYQAACRYEEHLAAAHLVPAPSWTSSLDELSRQNLRARNASTRLGVARVRILPCYGTAGGLTLDLAGQRPLPEGNLSTADIREILEHTVTVPAPWVALRSGGPPLPASWREQTWLHDLMLLPLERDCPGAWQHFGAHSLRLDADLGIVHRGPRAQK